jgi:hypothetical protein
MAFPSTITDIVATTIQSRTGEIADNVTNNNAVLLWLKKAGNIQEFSGGDVILHEISFAANANAGFYSGYDLLPVAAQDVLSAAQYSITQAACPVVISGLEMLQNSGKQRIIDLLDERLQVAEASMANIISTALYGDGTSFGGKALTGLNAAVPAGTSTGRIATGTYGGIDRSTTIGTFWRPFYQKDATFTSATVQASMNACWAPLVRGSDRPRLILTDSVGWQNYTASLQLIQRITQSETGQLGFPTLKYMDADVVLDGGIGAACPASTFFFLNPKYIKYRPHGDRNFVPLAPNKRYAVNQDAEVQIIGWAGNLTCGGDQFQGRIGTT